MSTIKKVLVFMSFLIFMLACSEEEIDTLVIPTLTTELSSSITSISAVSGGSIRSDGGSGVTSRGICWDTETNPTIALSTKTTDGIGTGSFVSSITGLTANTNYYVRAYATNSVGTAYGNEISFQTFTEIYMFVPV